MDIIYILKKNNFIVSSQNKRSIIKYKKYLINVKNKIKRNKFNFKLYNNTLYIIGCLCYCYKKYNKMIYFYELAINNGSSYSMNSLGYYYDVIENNYDKAIKYYIMAIDKGITDAMNNLGYYYHHNTNDEYNTIKYYMMAIDKGNYNSMYNLGHYYHFKKNNYELAVKYYMMAIDKGSPDAMCNLGQYYYSIENNYTESIKYHMMAINKGNLCAMCNMGYYYNIVEKDYFKAIKYYIMAINKGYQDAVYSLEKLFINNISVYINYILYNNYKPKNNKLCFIKNNLIKDNLECCICYDNFNYYIKTYCNHKYCYKCFIKLDTCAMCRTSII